MKDWSYFDDGLAEEHSGLLKAARRAERRQKAPAASQQKRERALTQIAEDTRGLETGFRMTYQPARYEEGWLGASLQGFHDQALIRDVLFAVKGGKEASVYCCEAHPTTGMGLLAAKVYRPRMFRNLRNDALYREGRVLLTEEGRAAKKTDHRIVRAMQKKTDFGAQVQHTSWLMYEYTTLQALHAAGAAVPRPFAANENAILMGYVGSRQQAAPPLVRVTLERAEAQRLLAETLRNIELLLRLGWVHGDLSAYNILYWQGRITLIDFPQIAHVEYNRNARALFWRDIRRVCDYFARQGVASDADAIAEGLWQQHGKDDTEWLAQDSAPDADE